MTDNILDERILQQDKKLYRWLILQKKNKENLTTEQIATLESVPGFSWYIGYKVNSVDADWDKVFDKVAKVVEKTGKLYELLLYPDLYRWVNKQKDEKYLLTQNQIAKLQSLPGFTFDPEKDLLPDDWGKNYDKVIKVIDNTGYLPTKESDNVLYRWLYLEKLNKPILDSWHITLLEDLPGFTWDTSKDIGALWENNDPRLEW